MKSCAEAKGVFFDLIQSRMMLLNWSCSSEMTEWTLHNFHEMNCFLLIFRMHIKFDHVPFAQLSHSAWLWPRHFRQFRYVWPHFHLIIYLFFATDIKIEDFFHCVIFVFKPIPDGFHFADFSSFIFRYMISSFVLFRKHALPKILLNSI